MATQGGPTSCALRARSVRRHDLSLNGAFAFKVASKNPKANASFVVEFNRSRMHERVCARIFPYSAGLSDKMCPLDEISILIMQPLAERIYLRAPVLSKSTIP